MSSHSICSYPELLLTLLVRATLVKLVYNLTGWNPFFLYLLFWLISIFYKVFIRQVVFRSRSVFLAWGRSEIMINVDVYIVVYKIVVHSISSKNIRRRLHILLCISLFLISCSWILKNNIIRSMLISYSNLLLVEGSQVDSVVILLVFPSLNWLLGRVLQSQSFDAIVHKASFRKSTSAWIS